MTVLAPAPFVARPDLRSRLASLVERGGAVIAMGATEGGPEGVHHADQAAFDLDMQDVMGARGGDEQAFERIVRRHQREVSRRLRRFSRDPLVHEELVQETFVQAYFGLKNYRADAPLAHWLHRIAVRVGYRLWRERRTRLPHVALDAESLRAPSLRERDASVLEGVMERLAPRDRLVLTLMHLDDRSVEETAELTGWSRGMVKVQAFRARRRLRALMEELSPGERP